MEGYPVKQYDVPVKRYCQTLEIEGDPRIDCRILQTSQRDLARDCARNTPSGHT